MKATKTMSLLLAFLLAGAGFMACDDANEYADTETDNPSWIENYTDSTAISHPASIANSTWVRGSGLKYNAYGEEVQGFVESMEFVSADSVAVKMSEGVTSGTWTDDSNTTSTPLYEYTYSEITGKLEVLKQVKDEKGKVSKSAIFTGIAVTGTQEVLTVCHYGDTPTQTYLVRK